MLRKFVAAMPKTFCGRCDQESCERFIVANGLDMALADESIRSLSASDSRTSSDPMPRRLLRWGSCWDSDLCFFHHLICAGFAIMSAKEGRCVMILYHGSQVESFTPAYGLGNDTHDYGRGFYTTADKELGKEWAVGQQANADGWLHVYEVDLAQLNVFDFATVGVLPWLAELMKHRPADDTPSYQRDSVRFIARYGIDLSGYDVIKGWRADASYFFIARMFARNQVDVLILGELLSLGDLGVQYFFKSERAFAALRELEEQKERVAMDEYKSRFNARDDLARRKMVELVYDLKRNPLEHVFSQLIREDDSGTSV